MQLLIRKLCRDSKKIFGKRDQDCCPQELFFCTTVLDLTVLPQLWISWTPGVRKLFLIHHIVLIWHCWASICYQKWKAPRGQWFHSSDDIQNEVKKWLHARGPLFFCDGLDKLIYHWSKCLKRLGDCVEK
jgi:hypothetical protein